MTKNKTCVYCFQTYLCYYFNHSMLFKTLVSILYTLMHEEFKVTICYMLFNIQHYRYVCTIITFNIFGRFHLIFAQTCAPALIFRLPYNNDKITNFFLKLYNFYSFHPLYDDEYKEEKNIRCVCEAISVTNFYKFLLIQGNYSFPATFSQ